MKLAIAMMMFLAGYANAESVNPASNVTADSANTAGTVVYRDSSGNFSAGAITATGITLNGSATGNFSNATTSTTLRQATPASIGIEYTILRDNGGFAYMHCASTGTGKGDVALSTATAP